MVWDSSAHILNGHKDVLITNQTMQLRGNYFETNLNEDRVVLRNITKVRIKGIFKQTCISEWACSNKLVSSITKKLNL